LNRVESFRAFRPKVIALFIVILSLLSVGYVIAASGLIDKSETFGCSIAFSTGLPQLAPSSSDPSRGGILTFLAKPDSISHICVRYSPAISSDLAKEAIVGVGNNTILPDGGRSFFIIPTSDVRMEAKLFPTSDNKSNIADFQIRTSTNSPGYYFLALPKTCIAIPLAVGRDPAKLTRSDFPGMGIPPCPNWYNQAIIVDVSNLSYIYLAY